MSAVFDIFPIADEAEAPAPSAPKTAVATAAANSLNIDKLDLRSLALARFGLWRKQLDDATKTLTGVVHDLSTQSKIDDAKSLRQRLINAPLAEARKVSKGLKSKLSTASDDVGAELKLIEAGYTEAATLITPQIEARESQLAIEKAEREAKEAERTAAHRANIAKLAGYVVQFQGKPSDQILAAINKISTVVIVPEAWEEFAAGAEIQLEKTLDALQTLFDRTKTAEDEAAAQAAQRVENERVAAELAEAQRLLAEKQAEVDRKLAAIEAVERAEAARVEAAAKAVSDAEAKAQREAQEAADAIARQTAEDEANAKAQEVAAALQELVDIGQEIERDAEELSDDALIAGTEIADGMSPASAPAAADMADVTAKAWALPAGPVTFAEAEPVNGVALLLAHIDEAFTGRFAAHPKPSREWWGALRRLSDEAREFVAG